MEKNLESKVDVALEQIRQLRSDVTDIKNKLDSNYVTVEQHNSVVKRVDNLEDNNKWIVRLVLSFIITALLGLVIVAKI